MKSNKPVKKAVDKTEKKSVKQKITPKKSARKKDGDDDGINDEDFEEFNFDNDFKMDSLKSYDDFDEDEDY
jgi:hypothetical protein